MGIGHQENGFDIVVHLLVHGDHLELVLEVRDGPQAADDDLAPHCSAKCISRLSNGRASISAPLASLRASCITIVDALLEREQRTLVLR